MTIKIALDAMGGDLAIDSVVGGMDRFLQDSPKANVFFYLYGNQEKIEASLKKLAVKKSDFFELIHTETKIDNNMKPSHALRNGRGSSMFEAILSVAEGRTDAVVSAGNTGAYMALSKVILKTIGGIDRPALVSLIPNVSGHGNVVLDLGANTECSPVNLFQFALMGNAVAKALLQTEQPRIGLLNVGTEKTKGTDKIKEAFDLISAEFGEKFVGFVEGTDIQKETANVIVTDGFSGNIALKAIEGTFRFIAKLYQKGVTSSLRGKVSYLLSKPILDQIWDTIDPRKHNGASLVGLQGIAVKSHGNADAYSFSSAISVALKLAQSDFVNNIKKLIK